MRANVLLAKVLRIYPSTQQIDNKYAPAPWRKLESHEVHVEGTTVWSGV